MRIFDKVLRGFCVTLSGSKEQPWLPDREKDDNGRNRHDLPRAAIASHR
jgi:hypothetical protein